ncbi:MAG: hypothetical protein K6E84_01955 [Lachnospiraceae bacterium]|nr:hypothetical protein [Lachnospiraceae bacterium]
MDNMGEITEMNELDELESMFGQSEADVAKVEQAVLSQNDAVLEGFASCFPEWDLHPPV